MIDAWQAFWLALVQGLTEFLPISSSGHLALVPVMLGWPDQGLAFDVAVHVGSLVAILAYFRADVWKLIMAIPRALRFSDDADSRMLWYLVLATAPIIIFGALLADTVETYLRDPRVIAWASIIFGVVLLIADQAGRRSQSLDRLNWRHALWVGCAQVLALIPGASRSGVTLSAGLLLGYTRTEAARFAFLLSIPTILAAGVYKGMGLIKHAVDIDSSLFALGIVVSAVSAFLCVALFIRLIERVGLLPFVIYRVLLGVVLLIVYR
ncbi:MAG: undecaprenyl-diphosphatase [marine bacterium B5-7]|nr:MAG: undecaprenyl-diphosphatase [marine bacterium B5-7]